MITSEELLCEDEEEVGEAEPVITTIFDGSFSIGYSYEDGKGSVTLSADIDELINETYDCEYYEDEYDWYWISFFEKIICSFDGELKFSFEIDGE